MEIPQQLSWANGRSPSLAWQRGNKNRFKWGSLNVGDSCMARTDSGAIGIETRIYPYCLQWFSSTYFLWRDIMLRLDIVAEPWFCLKAMCYTLLSPHGKPYPLWGKDGKLYGGILEEEKPSTVETSWNLLRVTIVMSPRNVEYEVWTSNSRIGAPNHLENLQPTICPSCNKC